MATLLVITVLLPLLGSLVLVADARSSSTDTARIDRAGDRAGDAGLQPDPALRRSDSEVRGPQFAFGRRTAATA